MTMNKTTTKDMLQTHPGPIRGDLDVLVRCIEACFECAQTCTTCADACLGEQELRMLKRCIRLNLDCADICDTTGRMLSRQTEMDWGLAHSMLSTCAEACRICGAECQQHAEHHEHCRVCTEACRRCEEACNQLLSAVPA
jgi:hypothetical protein